MVWQHFETLCTIPRPSKHEQQLRQHLKNWAEQRNLDTYIDDIGNIIRTAKCLIWLLPQNIRQIR